MGLDSKIPAGPLKDKWKHHKDHMNLVAPNNRDKIDIIIVGTGLAGGSAAATLAEQGYNVKAFCYQDFLEEHTLLQLRGELTLLKTIKETVTLLTDCSMTRSKVEITAQEKLTYTD